MTQAAAASKDLMVGRERRSDGLWTHKGVLNAGMVRVQGPSIVTPLSGAGLEVHYDVAAGQGYLVAYDRSANAYKDLSISAHNISLSLGPGGALNLPVGGVTSAALADGAVTTAKLATDAARWLAGAYTLPNNWSTSTINTWLETTVAVTATFTGVPVQAIGAVSMLHSAAGAGWHVGIGLDGTVLASVAFVHEPVTNYSVAIPVMWRLGGLTPGSHRIAVFVYSTVAGTLQFNGSTEAQLYCYEERR